MPWHAMASNDVTARFGVDPERGLSAIEAAERLRRHGPNQIREATRRSAALIFAKQFTDLLIVILLVAAIVSGVLGDLKDTILMVVIIVLNAVIGFFQEWRAERAMAALKQLAAVTASVVRDGHPMEIPAAALVPGDIVRLDAGAAVPADLRLLEAAALKVGEASLTGESVPVDKRVDVLGDAVVSLGDRTNMAFKGTMVTHGRARGVVVATGMGTEFGKIAGLLATSQEPKTLLQRRLAKFSRRLALVIATVCLLILAIGLLRGEAPLLMFLTAVSLAVSAIPESLPAVITIVLALGARRMARRHALIRRLPAAETLGSITVICSDKTGTLTRNEMRVDTIRLAGEPDLATPARSDLVRALALCTDVVRRADGTLEGDPTEIALWQEAADAGLDVATLRSSMKRLGELPFDSERKRMTTFHEADIGVVAYTKGAPESVIPLCRFTQARQDLAPIDRAATLAAAEDMARQGLRVLAVAERRWDSLPTTMDAALTEVDLVLLGLIGLMDPPRPEAEAAVAECVSAGITPVMITGDHPATARAVAERLGIIVPGGTALLTGTELAALSERALQERVGELRIYARVDPAQKIRIVEALQSRGEHVAMTGDGVNDAPALKRADIGVAMGKVGTDAAREAASLILLDDNFATIVGAVREGRHIYDNIRKFIKYAITTNASEVWLILLAPLLGLPIPLLPTQILWINLVTDGLPGLALAAEPAERDIMKRPPRPPGESIFALGMWQHMLWVSLLMAGLAILIQAYGVQSASPRWQTMVFTFMTLAQMAHVLAIRSERRSLFQQGVFSNSPLFGAVLLTAGLQMLLTYVPALNVVFNTQPLTFAELAICAIGALIVFSAVEIEKWLIRRGALYAPTR